MAGDVATIRAGIKTRLDTLSNFINVFDYSPDRVVGPCAIVLFSEADYFETASANGATRYVFQVIVVAARWDSEHGQNTLDGYISGSNSVQTAIFGDPTLNGAASTASAKTCGNYGMIQIADSQWWAATFDIEVIA